MLVSKSLSAVRRIPRDVLIIAILVLASSLSFGLGYLAGLDACLPNRGQGGTAIQESSLATTTVGNVVASKSGTKYYPPSCAGANKISDANKIWFASAEFAEAAGYTPAANCK